MLFLSDKNVSTLQATPAPRSPHESSHPPNPTRINNIEKNLFAISLFKFPTFFFDSRSLRGIFKKAGKLNKQQKKTRSHSEWILTWITMFQIDEIRILWIKGGPTTRSKNKRRNAVVYYFSQDIGYMRLWAHNGFMLCLNGSHASHFQAIVSISITIHNIKRRNYQSDQLSWISYQISMTESSWWA